MSHLIIEQGKEMGRQITVPEEGLKFGRSPVNDIVLKHPSVMLFHGRFFFKSDNTLWVTDFGAAEKTTVQGEPIDEIQLNSGDLVKVGATAFRVRHAVLNESDAEVGATPASPVRPVAAPKAATKVAPIAEKSPSIDPGIKSKPVAPPRAAPLPAQFSTSKNASPGGKLVVPLVILVLLGVVGYVGFSMMDRPAEQVAVKAPVKDVLTFSYERVIGSGDNIIRYSLELDGTGLLTVQMDDVKNGRQNAKRVETSEKRRKQLSNALFNTGFFAVSGDREAAASDVYDLYTLAVMRNHAFNQVRVLNRTMPPGLKRAVQLVEEFAQSEMGILFIWDLTEPELMELANQAYRMAETRYLEREVNRGNLWAALRKYEEAQLCMETMDPKPELFRKASNGIEKVEDALEEKFNGMMALVEESIRQENYEDAAINLTYLTEVIPDPSDGRHQTIRSRLLQVKEHLK
jgi:pSer/pThr/pTyr-binding forkhead associated (FHA) protein